MSPLPKRHATLAADFFAPLPTSREDFPSTFLTGVAKAADAAMEHVLEVDALRRAGFAVAEDVL